MTTTMQLSLDAFALKPFTKALTCLSRYGDELSIYATPDSVSLSATNSSKSAYCRIKYDKLFFSRYSVGPQREVLATQFEDATSVTGQLLTRSLLSILKHRTMEKTVERCEMSIIEGHEPTPNIARDDQDDLESRLILRLHCKHGVIKTHRLILLTPTSLMAPGIPEVLNESNLTIGPKALKDMIDHFPLARGPKSDPQLIWSFGEADVELRSLESSVDAKGKAQLATELTISAEEFDVYNVYAPPITIAFHLREFNATIAYADSMSLAIDLRFTDPAAPLFIDVESDNSETLFVISTSQVHGAIMGAPSQNHATPSAKKREREETLSEMNNKKPMKAVQRMDSRIPSVPHTLDTNPAPLMGSVGAPSQRDISPTVPMPPPHFIPSCVELTASSHEPLFLPPSSQLSAVEEETLRSTGLGIEDMDVHELTDLLEGEGEEVAFDFASQDPNYHNFLERPQRNDAPGLQGGDDIVIPPTQGLGDNKTFQALFED